MKKWNMLLIRTDNKIIPVEISQNIEQGLNEMYERIGCDTIDIARLDANSAMVVDDMGLFDGAHFNGIASVLYGHALYGNAIVAGIGQDEYNDGDILIDTPQKWIDLIYELADSFSWQ